MKTAQLRLKLPGWSKTGMTAVTLYCLQQMNSHVKHIINGLPGAALVLWAVYLLQAPKTHNSPLKIAAVGRVERPEPVFTDTVERGQLIFKKDCNKCHTVFGGHARLPQDIDNDHWADRQELFKWLQDPVFYMKNEPYGKALFERFGVVCLQPTPRLNWVEMEDVIAYLRYCREKQW